MSASCRWLSLLFAFLGLVHSAAAIASEEEPMLNVFLKGRDIEQVSESLIQAINNNNFSFIRQQSIDSHLVPVEREARSVRIIYFCNFDLMSLALAIDTRTAEFLPCRITLTETAGGVEMTAVNPAWVSGRLGNDRLHEYCRQMKKDYLTIMNEGAL